MNGKGDETRWAVRAGYSDRSRSIDINLVSRVRPKTPEMKCTVHGFFFIPRDMTLAAHESMRHR